MSHIERKKIKGRVYLYRYQCYRDENGKVKKKLLAYLGPESDFESIINGSKAGKASAVGVDDGRK
jgi:hypothetical protein